MLLGSNILKEEHLLQYTSHYFNCPKSLVVYPVCCRVLNLSEFLQDLNAARIQWNGGLEEFY
jgi:hypothetical protein